MESSFRLTRSALFVAAGFTLAATLTALRADEGYWLFDDAPTQAIADKYHVTLDTAWLDHLRGAVVKIGGGTGSFVSADGLVITNRHIGEGQLHTLSTRTHNYEENGFYAPTFADELHCQGLEMMVLQSTENVTARVKAALKPGASPDEAEAQLRAATAAIEKESFDRTGLTSNVVTLFGGARFTISTATRNIPTCGWSSRPTGTWPRSVATPTTSSSRATTSISPSSASTTTATRSTRAIISSGTPPAQRRTSSFSWPVIPAPRSGSLPWTN
jgi:hypothetical protein